MKYWIACVFAATLLFLGIPRSALAGYFEIDGGFSFSNSNYGDGNYDWTRRWTASIGYHFTERTEVEVSFQDVVDRTSISGYQDTTFHDQSYSVAWIQSLFGREAIIDPFFKLGLGQLDHVATGTYYALGGSSANAEVGSLTEVMGVGIRIGVTHRFAVRVEADTYITDWQISSWRNNDYFMVGLSFYF